MGSKPKTATQTTDMKTTQVNTPWAPAEPALTDLVKQAQTAYAATPKTPVFTGPNADQLSSIDALRALAPTLGQGSDSLRGLADQTASGYFLDPSTNKYIKGAVDAAIHPLEDALGGRVLSIGDQATMAGAYGGDRQALLKSTALKDFNTAALDASNRIYYDNYTRERQNQMNAGALYTQANDLALQPAKVLSAIGDQQQQWSTAAAQAALDAPWAGLDRETAVLQSLTPYASQAGTQQGTTTAPVGQTGGIAGGLTGALGGAAAGAAFGPWGAGIGAVVGGLGGLFG